MKANTYPFHPGGVVVKNNVVTLTDPLRGDVIAQAALPAGCEPGDLYRQLRLFELFPDRAWSVGAPFAAQAKLQLLRLERERQVDGAVTYLVDGEAQGVQPWLAEVYYGGDTGRQWQLDIPLPKARTGDIGLLLSVGDAIHSIIGGVPARGRPGDTKTVTASSVFTPESLQAARTWRTARRSVAETLELYAAQVERQASKF